MKTNLLIQTSSTCHADVRKINTLIILSKPHSCTSQKGCFQDDMDVAINLVKDCIAMLIPQKEDNTAIFGLAEANKSLTKNAIKDAERKYKQDIDDRRQHYIKFLNTIGEMTFFNCDKCGGKGRVRVNKDEFGKSEPAECGVCKGTRGQYRRFSHSSMRAWFADVKIMPSHLISEFLQLALHTKTITTLGSGDFRINANLKDPKFIRAINSESFGDIKRKKKIKKLIQNEILKLQSRLKRTLRYPLKLLSLVQVTFQLRYLDQVTSQNNYCAE